VTARGADGTWLTALLARNAGCAYLGAHGSPETPEDFRERMPVVSYEDLEAHWLPRVFEGEPDVLFAGRPLAYEKTGGSSGGCKRIPYSAHGLADFQAAVVPWLADAVDRYGISGQVYFSISPATRASEAIAGVPVGLPDGAYLGQDWGAWLARHLAVPLDLMAETDVDRWRARTLQALGAADHLQMISVWSPTFLLRLLDELPDPRTMWPQLKLVSCWADASSRAAYEELRRRLPQARFQSKGLLSTECVVTVPDDEDRAVLTPHGFFEFESGGVQWLANQLDPEHDYEVIATTGSGLYRYRTGDLVRCKGFNESGSPVLTFMGRQGVSTDLVGEKLVEAFVEDALAPLPGFRFLAPRPDGNGYVLVTDASAPEPSLREVEERLARNPQYAYARDLGQLRAIEHVAVERLFDRYVAHQVARGVRVGDVKPLALMRDPSWIPAWSNA
jgi:hypothetical protein